MNFRNSIRFASAAAVAGLLSVAGHLSAKENVVTSHHKAVPKTTAAGCIPATAAIDMDINNVRARLMTGGDMWWNIGQNIAAYEIPKGSGKHSQFAASCWIGGVDQQGQLKVAAQTYRQDGNDYWPGALDQSGKISKDNCALWDMIWKVDKSTINAFIAAYKTNTSAYQLGDYDVIRQWPGAKGAHAEGTNNVSLGLDAYPYSNNTYAPFKDLNGNGIYEPEQGEYPDIKGDQFLWWVFNDAGNVKEQSGTATMGVEVQTSAFAYATQDFLNNATFYNYRVINRGALTIDSTYIAVWDDCDLGYYLDDFIGCDTTRGLGIQYNGTNNDGASGGNPVNSYGPNPPQVGVDFFKGPKRLIHRTAAQGGDTLETLPMTNFTYFNNDASAIGNPDNGVQIYYYMTGSIKTGQRFADDFQGPGIPTKGYGSGPVSNFVFFGDPGNPTEWSECACNNNPGDRRFIFSSGPFTLVPGALNDITFGCIWAAGVGGCPNTSFKTIKSIDDQAQNLFINDFKTVEGPEAPNLTVRELDRKAIFYLTNPSFSNNYGENYGRADGKYKDSVQYHQAAVKALGSSNPTDSLYQFEGYRIFQLANSEVSSADIFNQTTGEVDPTKAVEVFQCDIRNGVTQIVNYAKNINISDTTFFPEVKVNGKDSGIVHSFELTSDAFSTTSDKRLVNYQTYYFVAIAYAFNNFASFNPSGNFPLVTQDVAYIGSAHAAGGADIQVVQVMPNPANGAMGTTINADYGSGVVVTRVEGVGNGGNTVELDSASEATAVESNVVGKATYLVGQAPIDVKVLDPVRDSAYNWILQIKGRTGTTTNTALLGVVDSGSWTLTAIDAKGQVHDVIYSEQNLGAINEQIVDKYGLSITVNQVSPPGIDQQHGDGYITSDVTFDDISKPWLAGVADQADSNFSNWLRSGNVQTYVQGLAITNPCDFNDYTKLDTNSYYENMMSNFTPTKSTWGPYSLAAAFLGKHYSKGAPCGFEIAYSPTTQGTSVAPAPFEVLPDVDLVFTMDKSKWTRCAVVEEQEDVLLSQKGAAKFSLRNHASWDLDIAPDGITPIYSDASTGFSYFPGYAVNEGTGERLNIVFGEDSYLTSDNGADMLWNPSSTILSPYDNSIVFGGKHVVYISSTRYDSGRAFAALVSSGNTTSIKNAYAAMQWTGIPTLSPNVNFTSLKDGLIPTKTRLRFRVNRPYAPYYASDTTNLNQVVAGAAANPYYTFSTADVAPTPLSDTSNRKGLLSRIYAVPNPYYGYSGYETSRFDTKVRIINLPAQTTIYIYALDGSLVRTLTKNDPNTSYIDWDIRNTAGLPVASGMYLMDVKAAGIGETVVKWFGAARPIDVTTY